MRRRVELEPGNIARRLARHVGDRLADHRAAVDVLPVRPGIVAPDGFAVEQQRRDRLAERPCELAVAAGLALVDLRSFGMKRAVRAVVRLCDLGRYWRGCCVCYCCCCDLCDGRRCDKHGILFRPKWSAARNEQCEIRDSAGYSSSPRVSLRSTR